ncbi:PREDICTED: putative RING-H2 finger protein ATL50 [Nicrophorus vespilloides]|uniref:RING-H2 finger protein ATL50 n=1 Tax=Nicrophorus vespilloides TaxID=110193 RepID=A0ABM1MFV4_NICVS|nr:PREDICTED: putative RING-H2 finger protein ATL50 [Nicrophorus vespilloides]
MSLPGIGFVFVVGAALASIAYAVYYQSSRRPQAYSNSNKTYYYAGYDTNAPPKSDENNCAICLNELISDVRQLPCKHIFHIKCIDSWTERNRICPICRKSL